MTVPEKVAELVERFEEQRDDYRSARYNETLLRRDFLDPFFTALGWDVDNRKGYSERFREVIHEYGLRVRGGTQAVDYCFRLGREPIFLVEAKKPAVDIRPETGPAYQLRNYGWNLKLPASILTDFEEFAVYDCRAAPGKRDRAGIGRLIYWKYTEYLDHWDRLVELFSPEGIRRGELSQRAEDCHGRNSIGYEIREQYFKSAGRGVTHATSNLLSKARTHLHLNPQGGPHGFFTRAHATV